MGKIYNHDYSFKSRDLYLNKYNFEKIDLNEIISKMCILKQEYNNNARNSHRSKIDDKFFIRIIRALNGDFFIRTSFNNPRDVKLFMHTFINNFDDLELVFINSIEINDGYIYFCYTDMNINKYIDVSLQLL